jgi:excisionase family DNA binding protein
MVRQDLETVKTAAKRLGYSEANITKLIREGKLKAIRRGRKYFIDPADLNTYAFVKSDDYEQFFS